MLYAFNKTLDEFECLYTNTEVLLKIRLWENKHEINCATFAGF